MVDKDISLEALSDEASFLADLIINRYTSDEGAIFETVDVHNGKVIDNACAVDELGDYIQYIIYLGIITSKKSYVDWGVNAIHSISRSYQSKKGLFFNKPKSSGNLISKNLLSLNNADTITGLVSSYIYSECPSLRPVIDSFISGTLKYFTEDDYITYGYLLGDKCKVSMSSLLFTGYFVEEVLTVIEFTNNRSWINAIERILYRNLHNEYFLKHGLFQARIPLGFKGTLWRIIYKGLKRDDLESTFLVKDNLYFLFGLLKYYTLEKSDPVRETIVRVYDRLLEIFAPENQTYNTWNPDKGIMGRPSPLALCHSLIELQLDLFHELGDESYLREASTTAGRWLNQISPLGLVNETVFMDENYALLDPNVDFAVNLIKLSEKTGDVRYRESALEILLAIISHFKAPYGYYWMINTRSGTSSQSHIETKYLGLLLKLFLLYMESLRGRRIFEDPILRNLAKDR